jgi:hypothetical protein
VSVIEYEGGGGWGDDGLGVVYKIRGGKVGGGEECCRWGGFSCGFGC